MPAPVHARDAVTLIVLDNRPPAPRVLMGRRSVTARFMPLCHVFPGGAVDAADFNAPVATALAPLTQAQIRRAADPALAAALAIAAARELREETGLSLGCPPALDGLRYLCRAITPPDWPIRFNARFLVVERDRLAGGADAPLAGDGELDELGWYRLDQVRRLTLSSPTAAALALLRRRLLDPATWPDHPDAALPVLRTNDDAWTTE